MSMSGEHVAFFVLAVLVIGGAVFMLNMTRVVHMVMSLALTMLGTAGIYILLNAEFIAVVQVLIYSGAVTVLMLFGIMLTRHKDSEEAPRSKWHDTFAFIACGLLVVLLMWGVYTTVFPADVADVSEYTVKNIGSYVFKHYVIPFELTSLFLLVVLIGAIILAKREVDR